MSREADIELLSAYLDGQVSPAERERARRTLESDPTARAHYDGMRRVAGRLQGLERAAPPSTLRADVARRIAIEGEHTSLLDRVEDGLDRFGGQSTTFAMFALVFSLAMIVILFSQAVERTRTALLPVTFEEQQQAMLPADLETARQVLVAGRLFERRGTLWIEDGVHAPADRVVRFESAEGARLLEAHPELRGVRHLERARVLLDGEILDLLEVGSPDPDPTVGDPARSESRRALGG